MGKSFLYALINLFLSSITEGTDVEKKVTYISPEMMADKYEMLMTFRISGNTKIRAL